MVDIDLKALSIADLDKLASDIQREIDQRRSQEIKQTAAQIKALAAQAGLSLEDILRIKPKQKTPVKYRNPENPEQTWTGRGKRPDWLRNALNSGRELMEFSID